MSLPKKNYNQIKERVDSLNNLKFYEAKYSYTIKENENLSTEQIDDLKMEVNGVKFFSSLNDSLAKKKILSWLDSLVSKDLLSEYNLEELNSRSFKEKLSDMNLDKLLDFK